MRRRPFFGLPCAEKGQEAMFKDLLRSRKLLADNENSPDRVRDVDLPSHSNVRALATGAALAVSLDASPAVLVPIYDYAHHYRDRPRRCA
jgi:hypothetical protein